MFKKQANKCDDLIMLEIVKKYLAFDSCADLAIWLSGLKSVIECRHKNAIVNKFKGFITTEKKLSLSGV